MSSSETVRVHRSTKVVEDIPSNDLVPGDIIELPMHQATVVCDAVLLTGQCILNESMLTGTIERQLYDDNRAMIHCKLLLLSLLVYS